MLILTSRFILPIYLIPVVLYFLKFFFIFVVMFAMLMMICSSTSAWKMQHNVSKFKHKHDELKGFVKPNNQHYTNTWVSFIEGGSHLVQKIADIHGYVILKEVSYGLRAHTFLTHSHFV